MALTYFKRYRMEIDLHAGLFSRGELPGGYQFVPWHPELLDLHADCKYRSFCCEIDANVFPCLGDREGCQRLMRDIAQRGNFVEGATWLVVYQPTGAPSEYCGTIQGISDGALGAVQNLGVTPNHRGQGLGSLLLFRGLQGFWEAGLRRAYLEVTAQNSGALRLYHRLGFRKVKTVYKAAEVAYV